MVRVKLPLGEVTPDQLDAFAAGVEQWVPLRKGHITTRQNIQMHHIPLADTAQLIRELGNAGLSSREGCGNTMRNVTGDPRAGVLPGEEFDITPYATAYVRYFVRHPTTQMMPRKFKVAFASTAGDNTIAKIHDAAFLPVVRALRITLIRRCKSYALDCMPRWRSSSAENFKTQLAVCKMRLRHIPVLCVPSRKRQQL